MKTIENKKLLIFKGFLFLLIAVLASAILLGERFSLRNLFLLLLIIWASCRFYYFMFYVIEKYVDADYKFSGVGSFILYFLRNKK